MLITLTGIVLIVIGIIIIWLCIKVPKFKKVGKYFGIVFLSVGFAWMRTMNPIFRITKQTHTYKEESIMTRDEFLNMDWSDSQIGYDMQVVLPDSDSRTIAYLTLSKKYPNSLCLVTDSKEFPIMNSGCGISKNPTPYDVIFKLKEDTKIKKVIAIVDNKVYDLDPGYVKMNHYDSILRFERARNLIYL